MNEDAHPAGHYEAHPEVTWDLAEERWLGSHGRSDVLEAHCHSCGWRSEGEHVPATPKRQRIAEYVTANAHSYQCPGAEVVFTWVAARAQRAAGGPAYCRVYHQSESGPFVELRSRPEPRRAVLSRQSDDKDYAYVRELSPIGQRLYKKLVARGFPAARALAFAKMAQKTRLFRRRPS